MTKEEIEEYREYLIMFEERERLTPTFRNGVTVGMLIINGIFLVRQNEFDEWMFWVGAVCFTVGFLYGIWMLRHLHKLQYEPFAQYRKESL